LIHGDLWSGNAMTDSQGCPALIDPATHYGWAEAELAMTSLFGSFPDEFYQSYNEVRKLEPGFRSRFPVYNLYHLLNHVLLFGQGYLGQVKAIINRYK
jgi:fructosamine-3-kinase